MQLDFWEGNFAKVQNRVEKRREGKGWMAKEPFARCRQPGAFYCKPQMFTEYSVRNVTVNEAANVIFNMHGYNTHFLFSKHFFEIFGEVQYFLINSIKMTMDRRQPVLDS